MSLLNNYSNNNIITSDDSNDDNDIIATNDFNNIKQNNLIKNKSETDIQNYIYNEEYNIKLKKNKKIYVILHDDQPILYVNNKDDARRSLLDIAKIINEKMLCDYSNQNIYFEFANEHTINLI